MIRCHTLCFSMYLTCAQSLSWSLRVQCLGGEEPLEGKWKPTPDLFHNSLRHCSLLLNTLKATSTNWEGLISMHFNLWGVSWWGSHLSSLHSQGPQSLYLCSTYKLDKFFLETLMGPQLTFVSSPEFCFRSLVWAPCWVFPRPSTVVLTLFSPDAIGQMLPHMAPLFPAFNKTPPTVKLRNSWVSHPEPTALLILTYIGPTAYYNSIVKYNCEPMTMVTIIFHSFIQCMPKRALFQDRWSNYYL